MFLVFRSSALVRLITPACVWGGLWGRGTPWAALGLFGICGWRMWQQNTHFVLQPEERKTTHAGRAYPQHMDLKQTFPNEPEIKMVLPSMTAVHYIQKKLLKCRLFSSRRWFQKGTLCGNAGEQVRFLSGTFTETWLWAEVMFEVSSKSLQTFWYGWMLCWEPRAKQSLLQIKQPRQDTSRNDLQMMAGGRWQSEPSCLEPSAVSLTPCGQRRPTQREGSSSI